MAENRNDENNARLVAQVLEELEHCSLVYQSAEEVQAVTEQRHPRAEKYERELTLEQFPAE